MACSWPCRRRLHNSYAAVSARPSGPPLPASFSVAYGNPGSLTGSFWSSWRTMLAVLLVLVGGPLWVWRVLLFMRHKANAPMDLELLLYGGLAAADAFSAALVGVLFLVSGWECRAGRACARKLQQVLPRWAWQASSKQDRPGCWEQMPAPSAPTACRQCTCIGSLCPRRRCRCTGWC